MLHPQGDVVGRSIVLDHQRMVTDIRGSLLGKSPNICGRITSSTSRSARAPRARVVDEPRRVARRISA
jgi:hypothetical protein